MTARDAHLEILRQRQTYRILTEAAAETRSQIIAASHSEVLLNEAAGRDLVVAFVGAPHRLDNRGSQVLKALREFGFEHWGLPNVMPKKSYHVLARHVPRDEIVPEVVEVLDVIGRIAGAARGRE